MPSLYVKESTETDYDSVLVNLYEDEKDHVPWHTDDESIFCGGDIASVSFGETRRFQLRSMLYNIM